MDFKEYRAKTVEDALTEALIDLGTTSDKVEYEVIENGSAGLLGLFSKEAVIRARKKEDSTEDSVKKFLEDILEKMEVEGEVDIVVDEEEKNIVVDIKGSDTSDIIGKRGQTLDAIQYLANVVANKGQDDYYRLKLDTMNYRERRRKTLENLAKNTANKVKKVRHKIALDPMNPYERRIIHAYLQGDPQITTKSEGEEPNRRVVIYYNR